MEVFTVDNVFGLDPARTSFEGGRLRVDGLQQLGGQRVSEGRAHGVVETGRDGVAWRLGAECERPIKGIKLLLRGVPEKLWSEGWWTPTTPATKTLVASAGQPVQLTYPWPSWQTPWAAAGEDEAFVVSVRDPQVRAKRLYATRPHWSPNPVVEITCDESATARSSRFQAPEMRLRECPSRRDAMNDLGDHLASLESAYGLVSWDERPDVPPWARNLDLVLTLHGQHWTGYAFNTFDAMADVLEQVSQDVPGDRVLAYLPGWEGRYYWQYPDYRPGPDLGGEAGFARLAETAHRLGVHLMPMFGANGANVQRYPGWERAAFRSPSNNYVALINAPDWDNDRAPEDDQVFLNPGEPQFRQHMVRQIDDLLHRYPIDGVFLDTTACWFNDPRFDLYDGYRQLVAEIRRDHPQVLVCGEGWYDALLSVFPMNQTWLDMSQTPRSDDLPLRYARIVGHLKDGAPGVGSTGVHEGGVRPGAQPLRVRGYIPALSIVDDTLSNHRQAVSDFIHAVIGERL